MPTTTEHGDKKNLNETDIKETRKIREINVSGVEYREVIKAALSMVTTIRRK